MNKLKDATPTNASIPLHPYLISRHIQYFLFLMGVEKDVPTPMRAGRPESRKLYLDAFKPFTRKMNENDYRRSKSR